MAAIRSTVEASCHSHMQAQPSRILSSVTGLVVARAALCDMKKILGDVKEKSNIGRERDNVCSV